MYKVVALSVMLCLFSLFSVGCGGGAVRIAPDPQINQVAKIPAVAGARQMVRIKLPEGIKGQRILKLPASKLTVIEYEIQAEKMDGGYDSAYAQGLPGQEIEFLSPVGRIRFRVEGINEDYLTIVRGETATDIAVSATIPTVNVQLEWVAEPVQVSINGPVSPHPAQ